jgi:hypothetical protein
MIVTRKLEELSQERVERMAYILGPASAAHLALADAAKRRAKGELVAFYRDIRRNIILVGPPIPSDPHSDQ